MGRLRALLWTLVLTVWSVLIVAQIVLSFFFHISGVEGVRYVGWAVLAASAVFGWLPIWELRRKGKVPKGKSYVHTTVLVDSGIYDIVRHPQYLAGILLSAALILVTQHWLIAAIGVPVMVLGYADMVKADQDLIESFGDDYRRYMERVPRANAPAGLVRALRGRGASEDEWGKGREVEGEGSGRDDDSGPAVRGADRIVCGVLQLGRSGQNPGRNRAC